MIDISTAKKLIIENENNKLEQKEFIQIHFAPPRATFNKAGIFTGVITEASFNQVYVIDNNGQPVFVKLKDFTRIKFKDIVNYYTKLCSGIDSHSWKISFMTKYPVTTNETEMAIYYYQRVEK